VSDAAGVLAPGTRGLLLDVDGTLLADDRAVPGTPEALARLAASGLRLRLLTNTSRRGRADVGATLRAAGFDLADELVLTPALLARRLLLEQGERRAGLFVTPETRVDLAGIDDDRTRPAHVVLGDLGAGFTHAVLSEVFRLLRGGARLMALHRNPWWAPAGQEMVLDVGAYVAALEAASGTAALLVGKPARAFFDLACAEIGLPAASVAVVGDDALADARGALDAGCRAVLVRTGKHAPGDAAPPGVPVIASVADLR
jgi:HAD superfamily hydrolase (TIGR01458 family)